MKSFFSLKKEIIGIIIFLMIVFSLFFFSFSVNASVSGTRIKYFKQKINGKWQTIGCNLSDCSVHNHEKHEYGKCITGSDLFQIRVKDGNDYFSIYDYGFTSMQGGCIKGKNMYIMFSKKETLNRTLIVKINIKSKKVLEVKKVFGSGDVEFDSLGHSNDMTYKSSYFHVPWYQTNGKKEYSNRVGYIKKSLSENGKSKKVGKQKKLERNSPFGISKKGKYLAIAFRNAKYKNQKKLKKNDTKDIDRIIKLCSFKKGKYTIKKKSTIKIPGHKTFGAIQCMDYYKNKYFLIRFNDKGGKKNNNCVQMLNKKGKALKTIVIKDPGKIKKYVLKPGNELEKDASIADIEKHSDKKTMSTKSMKWEIENISHYKGNTFFYTQYKPSKKPNGKQAYLYYAKFK